MSASAPPPRSLAARVRRVGRRVAAHLVDVLLAAYALWALSFVWAPIVAGRRRDGWLVSPWGFIGERPWLLLLAPLLAVLWQASTTSLGQQWNGLRLVDASGRPAGRDRRAWRGLLAAVQTVVVLVPAGLGVLRVIDGRSGGLQFALSIGLALAMAALGLSERRGRSLPDVLAGTDLDPERDPAPRTIRPWWRRPNPWLVLGLVGLTLAVGVRLTQLDPLELVRGWDDVVTVFGGLFSPDWSITGTVIEKMVETIFIALLASALALPFAFGLSFLGARNVMGDSAGGRIVYGIARFVMNVTRSVEPLVWVIIFSAWVHMGAGAGMLALFVHSVAALGKLYSEAIESIDPGPVEAIRATGAGRLQVLRYGVVPQVVPTFLSFTVYRWDINVRMATILGFVGGGGIGMILRDAQEMLAWDKVAVMVVFITLVVWALDWISAKARQRLV